MMFMLVFPWRLLLLCAFVRRICLWLSVFVFVMLLQASVLLAVVMLFVFDHVCVVVSDIACVFAATACCR